MSSSQSILIANDFHEPTVRSLRERYQTFELASVPAEQRNDFVKSLGEDCRVVATASWDCDPAVYRLPGVGLIACFGVGVDGIDFAETGRLGVQVSNTPDVLTDAVADLAIGLLLSLTRDLPGADRFVREGRWSQGPYPFGRGIQGKTLGIAGYGRIGHAIARRAEAMDMAIAYHSRHPKNAQYRYYDSLLELAAASDVLVNVLPGGRETEKLVNRDVLRGIGPDGLLVNVGRGSSVDQDALVEALRNAELGGAALDVYEDEPNVPDALCQLPNVVLAPHIGSATIETRQAMGDLVLANIEAYLAGQKLPTPVG